MIPQTVEEMEKAVGYKILAVQKVNMPYCGGFTDYYCPYCYEKKGQRAYCLGTMPVADFNTFCRCPDCEKYFVVK